jgi:hypothetical protein
MGVAMFTKSKKSDPAETAAQDPPEEHAQPVPELARAAVVLVGPLIVSIFAGLGVSGDYLTRAVRNDPEMVRVAFNLIVVGLVLPIVSYGFSALVRPAKTQKAANAVLLVLRVILNVAGIGLVVTGTLLVSNHGVDSLVKREVPSLSAVATWPDAAAAPGAVTVEITATATSLRAEEDFLLRVVGIRPTDRYDLDSRCRSTDVALASPEDTGFRVLSRGNSGASADGTATTTVNVQASPAEFDFVCAYVVLRDRDRNVVDDDRWAWTVLDIRQAASDPG